MVSSKTVGAAIISLAIPLMIFYTLGILFYDQVFLEATAMIVVLGLLGVIVWIGYTMVTEPPAPRVRSPEELDNLEPETITSSTRTATSLAAPSAAGIGLDIPDGSSKYSVITDALIGEGTIIRDGVNLYKCRIGKNCKIESFVYIEENVVIGNSCKIKPNVFIPTGVIIEDNVFIGPNVTFTNDKYPRVNGEWQVRETLVGSGASIGAHAVILPGIRIGANALIGAGAVVTKDVPERAIVVGNPAREIKLKLSTKEAPSTSPVPLIEIKNDNLASTSSGNSSSSGVA